MQDCWVWLQCHVLHQGYESSTPPQHCDCYINCPGSLFSSEQHVIAEYIYIMLIFTLYSVHVRQKQASAFTVYTNTETLICM